MLAAAHETNLLCQLEAVLPTKQPSWRLSEPKLIPIVTTAEQVYTVSFAHFLPGLGVPCYYLPDTFNSKETGKVGNVFDKPGNNSQ